MGRTIQSILAKFNFHINIGICSSYQMPYALRHLFAMKLIYCEPDNPKRLWKKFEIPMSDDNALLYNEPNNIRSKVLEKINDILESMGKLISDYHLVDHNTRLSKEENTFKEINEELEIIVDEKYIAAIKSLNQKQKHAYDMKLEKVFNNEPRAFFIDGPSGSGKTYMYRTILATLRSKNMIVIATTSSGVAASILLSGQTAHSKFKILLNIKDSSICNISK